MAGLVAAAEVGIRSTDGLRAWPSTSLGPGELAHTTGTATGDAAAAPQAPLHFKPVGTFNGVQMGPHTILDEGIEHTLDLLAETAGTKPAFHRCGRAA